METTAIVRGVRLSAQKGRLVADLVRGKPVDKALNILTFTQKRAAVIIKKALESAIANAEHNFMDVRVERLFLGNERHNNESPYKKIFLPTASAPA